MMLNKTSSEWGLLSATVNSNLYEQNERDRSMIMYRSELVEAKSIVFDVLLLLVYDQHQVS